MASEPAMRDSGRQLRSWKDIATYLGASVRTAMRWENTRQLPVHRVGGLERDAVFANTAELDAWLVSGKGRSPRDTAGDPPEDPQPAAAPASHGGSDESGTAGVIPDRAPFAKRRLALGVALVLVGLCIGAAAVVRGRLDFFAAVPTPRSSAAQASTPGVPDTPAGPRARSVALRLSRPDEAGIELTLAEGECGRTGGSAGRPALLLRPRFAEGGLVLEIRRADGQPAKPHGSPGEPMAILLERGVSVRVLTPYLFDVEWIRTEEPNAKR